LVAILNVSGIISPTRLPEVTPEMKHSIWRFIDSGSLNAAQNMALDEALLLQFQPESSLPVVRIYRWEPHALSLGRFQDAAEVLNLDRCRCFNMPIVRRISGGGTVYHAEEFSYSIICAPHHLPESTSIKQAYRLLNSFLIAFYRNFGLDADFSVNSVTDMNIPMHSPFCYAGRETFDILIGGRKIGGNAQRRLRNVIFQHGSIPLLNRSQEGVQFMKKPPPDFSRRVTSLADEGVNLADDMLVYPLKQSLQSALCIELIDSDPDEAELEYADRLESDKYCRDMWNLHGTTS